VDARDREKIGLLLETDNGLTADWAVVKRVCGRFDERRDWAEVDSVGEAAAMTKKVEAPPPAKKEETRRWADGGSTSACSTAKCSSDTALEELTQMVRDLQIAHAWREGGKPVKERKPPAGSRCLWCNAIGHARKDCRDFTKALRAKVVCLSNGRVHNCKTRKMLELNVGRGGMKRLMEEAAARHAETVRERTVARHVRDRDCPLLSVGGNPGRR
jgi:hypothetical protein